MVTAFLKLARRLLRRRSHARAQIDGPTVCVLCETELRPEQARYRLAEGAAHKECYQRVTRFPPQAG